MHVTLGTVFATESGDLFPRLLTGLSQLPVEVVATVGREINPAEFGLQPEHVHIEQWVPQSLLLPHTDLVVSHGGSGTVTAALAHGLPQVVIAMGADQMHNAGRVKALGVGRALHPVTTTAAEIRDTVAALLPTTEHSRRRNRCSARSPHFPASTVHLHCSKPMPDTHQRHQATQLTSAMVTGPD